jgi:hypothetical protein
MQNYSLVCSSLCSQNRDNRLKFKKNNILKKYERENMMYEKVKSKII